MKIKTENLIGLALDWAVGTIDQPDWEPEDLMANLYLDDDGYHYSPSTDWGQGGPIIHREAITIRCDLRRQVGWEAFFWVPTQHDLVESDAMEHYKFGPTPLVAAMRCFVLAELGDEVEIPDELINDNEAAH